MLVLFVLYLYSSGIQGADMHVAIIGLGEVGRCYAKPLYEHGVRLSLCEARPSAAATELARAWGLPLHVAPGPWLADVDWVMSCVTGAQALPVAEQVSAHLARGAGLVNR